MRKNIIISAIVILLVLAFGFLYYKENNPTDYSIIYLTTGEVYVGKLTTFPNLELKDSYLLQVIKDVADPNKNNFNLSPIKDALWAPEILYLVKDNVIFYGPLSPESAIAKKLAEQIK